VPSLCGHPLLTTVEAILLCGCETWTLSARDKCRPDGCYTCMLRMVTNITWMDKMTNDDLYGNLPRISNKIRERRLGLAGHCARHSELEVSNLVLWEPTQGKVQQRESETDVCGQAQEGYRTSDYSGVDDTNEGQVRVACHCPRRLDLMMMIARTSEQLDPQFAGGSHVTAPLSRSRPSPHSPKAATHFPSH